MTALPLSRQPRLPKLESRGIVGETERTVMGGAEPELQMGMLPPGICIKAYEVRPQKRNTHKHRTLIFQKKACSLESKG